MPKQTVVFAPLGTTLDQGKAPSRWERWRPTVAVCQHDDLVVDRLELLHPTRFTSLAELVASDIAQVSPETTVRLHVLDFRDAWALDEVYEGLYEFARRYDFRADDEDYLFHITTGTHIAQICTFLLLESGDVPARLLQTSPPSGLHKTGPGTYSIIDLDLSKYDRIAARFERQQREALAFLKAGIDTRNRAFNQLIERIEHVALHSKDPILLTGPTGSGKSRLARRIYELRKAHHTVTGEFVEVNCATIRGDGAMSALFGHVKGAFTGALSDRPGMLKKAHGGVLFLDEIGELGGDEQAMLLRAVEDRTFFPVGSDREARSEFQLIAGSNRDLFADVGAGRFRTDLLARIDVWTFGLPGLSERPEDVEPNLEYELERCGRALNRRVTFSREARDAFVRFATSGDAAWLGNFRDFNAAVRRMATLAPAGRIGVAEVTEEFHRLEQSWKRGRTTGALGGDIVVRVLGTEAAARLDRFERVQLADVIRVCRQAPTLSEAGRRLFGMSRTQKKTSNDADRLRKYLARFGLDWPEIVAHKGTD